MLFLASILVSAGFLAFPPNVEVGALSAVVVDSKDQIFVLHRGPQPLMAFDKKGKFVRAWGEGLFKVAHGLRIDRNGELWTTDNGNHTLRKFTTDGKLLLSVEGKFKSPDDIVFATDGTAYVADTGNGRIVHMSATGELLGSWGKKGKGEGEFATAHAIAIDSRDRVYVADRGNNRVQVFEPSGKFVASWSGFGNPFGLLVAGGELIVSDGDAHRMTHLALDNGKIVSQWGDPSTLKLPHLMSMDSKRRLYVAEVNGKRVQIFKRK